MAMRRVGVVLAILVLGDGYACADRQSAKSAFNQGRKFYDIGEYSKALEEFKRAYLEYDDATFLYNIAQCHRQLGNKVEALRAYRSYLRNASPAANREEVKRTIATIEAAIADEKPHTDPPHDETAQAATASEPPAVPRQTMTSHEVAASASTARAPSSERDRVAHVPLYKKWWVWTLVGAGVAAGLGVGLGIGLSQRQSGFQPTLSDVHASLVEVRF